MALQVVFRTGSIFEACGDLLQTGDPYSAEEKHCARAVVRIVLAASTIVLIYPTNRDLRVRKHFTKAKHVMLTFSCCLRRRTRRITNE